MKILILDRTWLKESELKEIYGEDINVLKFSLTRPFLCRIYLRSIAQTSKALGIDKLIITVPKGDYGEDIGREYFVEKYLPELTFEISYIKEVINLDLDITIEYLDSMDMV